MITNSLIGLFKTHKVVIPPIQRDYAQGRNSGKIPHIRERFLDSIINVLIDDQLPVMELDFVYGYVEKDRSDKVDILRFKPLDGQQRLTTLFLIHWFIANKEPEIAKEKNYLKRFSYATRESSRRFCEELVDFIPQYTYKSIDEEISDQSWFFSAWHSDPTIKSILVVLKSIEQKFKSRNVTDWESMNIWGKLTSEHPRIIFHLLPMEDLGLPDDLYIKMNARGKGLTDFEHFKSQFSEVLSGDKSKEFNEKIDKKWSDLFWNIFKEKESKDIAKDVDNGFLSFFWYITDIIVNKKNITVTSKFWLDKIKEIYQNSDENVQFLFDALNLFEKLELEETPYFEDIFYIESKDFEITKTRIFFNNPQINLFRKCAETYGFEDKKNSFSVGEQLMLYAFIYMSFNSKFIDNSKFRLLRNVFASSEVQLRNDYLSKFLYTDVEKLIVENKYSVDSKLSRRQLEEEVFKVQLIVNYPELRESVFRLEDHSLLRGNISILPLDNSLPLYANQFHKIFNHDCNYFEISRAMLTIGDYGQNYSNLKRFGNGNNSTWRDLLTQSESRKGFENTGVILKSYFDLFINDVNTTDKDIVERYFEHFLKDNNFPKDWRYYYIKYHYFILWDNNQTEGFYKWDDYSNKPYKCTMMFRQYGGRNWSPFLLQISKMNKNLSLDNYGNDLQFTKGDIILLIKNGNSGFKFYAKDELSMNYISKLIQDNKLNENAVLLISKNEEGLDIEDRIIKCSEFLSTLQNEL